MPNKLVPLYCNIADLDTYSFDGILHIAYIDNTIHCVLGINNNVLLW